MRRALLGVLVMAGAAPAAAETAREAAAAFRAEVLRLPGQVSLLVTLDGKTLAAATADVPRAVGGAFKMQVLDAVTRQVAAGRFGWDHVLRVSDRRRAPGNSVINRWQRQAPVTVSTLANLMIGARDNTAADMLLNLVGVAEVERLAPPRARPFLTVRQFHLFRAPPNLTLHRAWAAANEAARRKLLAKLTETPVPPGGFGKYAFGWWAAWSYTAAELCALARRVHGLHAMRIDPGLARRARWKLMAFKGGALPGVLNYTHYGVRKDGRPVCVAASWNHTAPVKDARLAGPVRRLLQALETAD